MARPLPEIGETSLNNTSPEGFRQPVRKLYGHDTVINRIAWSPQQHILATTAFDKTIKLWDVGTQGSHPERLEGHKDWISSVTWSPDGRLLATGSGDNTIRIWDVDMGVATRVLSGHVRTVFDVAWSPQGNLLASASGDGTVALWDVKSGYQLQQVLLGHNGEVNCLAWSPDGRMLITGSEDTTLRLWDVDSGETIRIYEGHAGPVYQVAWSPDGRMIASGSEDSTVRLWGQVTGVLEGHTDIVTSVSFSSDNNFLASKSLDCTVRIWRCDTWNPVVIMNELASLYWTPSLSFHPHRPVLATLDRGDQMLRIWRYDPAVLREAAPVEQTVRYTNAKVVMVGDSGVGKTCLSDALRGKPFTPHDSTHGRQVWRYDTEERVVESEANTHEIREILLWDMAGQPSYRLIHQLHLNEVSVAMVMFDVSKEGDPFAGVKYWNRALIQAKLHQRQGQLHLKKFLVAGRVDRGGIGVSEDRIRNLMHDLAFDHFFPTSAREHIGIAELDSAIHRIIEWDKLPRVSSTTLFQRIKRYLNDQREDDQLLFTVDQLYDSFVFNLNLSESEEIDLRPQFETCIGLVEAQGMLRRFSFGDLILLQPELLDAYASAMITSARDETDGLGFMTESKAREGRFSMSPDSRIQNEGQERLLLIATVQDLIEHEIALREEDEHGNTMLVFPSQTTRAYPARLPRLDKSTTVWTFEGAVLNIYATLVVRLWHAGLFNQRETYENVVFYSKNGRENCRLFLIDQGEGEAELRMFYDEDQSSRVYVEEYIHAHLERRAMPGTLRKRRVIACDHCGSIMKDEHVERRRVRFDWMNCPVCDQRIDIGRADEETSARRSLLRQRMVVKLDETANKQRRRQTAVSIVQGKVATGDYDVYISYNRNDRSHVGSLYDTLREHAVLPWLDQRAGENGTVHLTPQQQVNKLAAENKAMLFVVSASGPDATQLQELHYARSAKLRVILVLLGDAGRKPRVPVDLLRQATRVDFREDDDKAVQQLVSAILRDRPSLDDHLSDGD